MKWFERYAAKHKPDFMSATGYGWKFFDFWRLHALLIVKTHTVIESRPCQVPSLTYVLQGQYLEHRLNGEKIEGDWIYTDSEGRWVVHEVKQGQLRAWEFGERQRIELYPAQRLADKLLDMPEWMGVKDVDFNTERQVWMLSFAWFKTPKVIAEIGQ